MRHLIFCDVSTTNVLNDSTLVEKVVNAQHIFAVKSHAALQGFALFAST